MLYFVAIRKGMITFPGNNVKRKNSSSLKFLASFDTPLDPRGAKVRNEMIREANTPVC